MNDPQPNPASRAPDGASDRDRAAKIEQLLLAGLDHYFAAEYEQAINVWTRALFLDRSHARARAYIERARSALAERQREGDELLQNGVAAFQRGESLEARRLLKKAIGAGAPSEDAFAILTRLDLLEHAAELQGPARAPVSYAPHALGLGAATTARSRVRPMLWLGLGMLAVGVALLAATRFAWRALPGENAVALSSPAMSTANEPGLPLPRRGEVALTRARAFAANGRLRDALAALDQVRPTDAQKTDADSLRAQIQRQLIGLATAPAPQADRGQGDNRQP